MFRRQSSGQYCAERDFAHGAKRAQLAMDPYRQVQQQKYHATILRLEDPESGLALVDVQKIDGYQGREATFGLLDKLVADTIRSTANAIRFKSAGVRSLSSTRNNYPALSDRSIAIIAVPRARASVGDADKTHISLDHSSWKHDINA